MCRQIVVISDYVSSIYKPNYVLGCRLVENCLIFFLIFSSCRNRVCQRSVPFGTSNGRSGGRPNARRSLPAGSLVLAPLVDWLRIHFFEGDLMAKRVMAEESPEDHHNFWPVVSAETRCRDGGGDAHLRFRTVLRRTTRKLRHLYRLLNLLTAATISENEVGRTKLNVSATAPCLSRVSGVHLPA